MIDANGHIQVGNKEHVLVNGIGNVRIRDKVGKEFVNITLKGVFFCPNMIQNFMNSSQAEKYGYKTGIETVKSADKQEILKLVNKASGNVDLMAYKTSNGLYTVTTVSVKTLCSISTKQAFMTSGTSRHERLGHGSLDRF